MMDHHWRLDRVLHWFHENQLEQVDQVELEFDQKINHDAIDMIDKICTDLQGRILLDDYLHAW